MGTPPADRDRAEGDRRAPRTWTLLPLTAAIVIPLSVGFILGGPTVGMLAGIAAAVVVIVTAIRQEPRVEAEARDRERVR